MNFGKTVNNKICWIFKGMDCFQSEKYSCINSYLTKRYANFHKDSRKILNMAFRNEIKPT